MEVKFIGESGSFKSVKGEDVSLTNGSVYKCMEKEYHSALFVRITDSDGTHIKVKRAELEKTH
jgi:hypothetical protein